MKRTDTVCVVILFVFLAMGSAAVAEELRSLRGAAPINAESPAPVPAAVVTGGSRIPRSFAEQPPLVPHAVEGYEIGLKENDCLDCHGVEGSGAPPPSASHYLDREGKKLTAVSSGRHFCDQCHVPQQNAPPLVENSFTAK